MSDKWDRIKNNTTYLASRFFVCYKYYLLVFFIVFFIGLLTGIITCSGYVKDLTPANLINKYLYAFLTKDCTLMSYFLTLSVYFLILSFLTIFLLRNKIMLVINIFVLCLLSYIFGFDLCIIIITLGLSGIILGILFIGILQLLVFTIYICLMAVVARRALAKEKCESQKEFWKTCILFMILAIIILFLSVFLFSTIHIFVIVD